MLRSFTLALLLCAGCASAPLTHGIPNLAEVAPGLLRCGQPTPAGFRWLVRNGYTNDVKLNVGTEPEAAAAGMHVVYLPITACQQLEGGPSMPTVSKAVAWMLRPGTAVHCAHGQDRTGLICGVYRVWVCHWTKRKAYAEMKAHNFHPLLKGLWDFWEDKVD